jgi:hypothetical protein
MRTKKKRSIKKIDEMVEDILVDVAAEKVADNIVGEDKPEEEDDETTLNTQTPTGDNGTEPAPAATAPNPTEDDKNEEPDPMIEYILQQIQQNKEKQLQDAQADYAYRQHQAQQIVSDIEDYIKQNSGK